MRPLYTSDALNFLILLSPMLRAATTTFFFFLIVTSFAQKEISTSKFSPLLKSLNKNLNANDSMDVLVHLEKETALNGRVLTPFVSGTKARLIRIRTGSLHELAANRHVYFIDLYFPPKEELTTGSLDIATNKINYSHASFADVNGAGISGSIKENRFDTTDIDYSSRYFNSGMASSFGTSHASIMATSLAGAANSSPYAKGVAHSAKITSSNFANLLPDPDSVFKKYSITIQNHSYGTVIQNYYGIEASAYDAHIIANPGIVHVFSSGNAGASSPTSGTYSGLTGFSNFTGNFKWAKNAVTVGAVDSFYHVADLSSKGPAFDGRIKPELVAFGQDGSSGAAALASGVAALLQQAYFQKHQKLPSSALIKAFLINGADDVGRNGPDFATGYGSLNAHASVKTVRDEKYFEGEVSQGQARSYIINVPARSKQVKVTLTWTDPAALPNVPKALINDLDVVLKNTSTGEEFHPWVLSTFAHADSLRLPAHRGVDTLNNAEQISVNLPSEGQYQILIKGKKVSGLQPFAVAYQIDSSSLFEWTFPTKHDQIIAGRQNVLRWQTNVSGTGTLEWSENGTIWMPVAENVDLAKSYFKWTPPDKFSLGQMRMQIPSAPSAVSDTFVISKAANLFTAFVCSDSLMLAWNNLPVNTYQLFALQNGYLEPVKTIADSSVVLKSSGTVYYAIAPVINGKAGLKSYAINYASNGVGCFFRAFYLQFQNDKTAEFTSLLGTNYSVRAVEFQKLKNNTFQTLQSLNAPAVTNLSFTDAALTRGENIYRVQLKLTSGQSVYSNLVTAYYFGDEDLIIYPNPVAQKQPVNFITQLAGRIDISVYNIAGVLIRQMRLKDLSTKSTTLNLSRGVYLIKATTEEGKTLMQRLVVY